MSKLYIHLGAPRTATSYLWDLVIRNDLHHNTVRLNTANELIRFTQHLNSLAPIRCANPQAVTRMQQFISLAVKEDQTFLNLLSYVNSGHPSQMKFNSDMWHKLYPRWQNKFHSDTKKTIDQLGNRADIISSHTGYDFVHSMEYLTGEQFGDYSSQLITWGDDKDWQLQSQADIPQLLIIPQYIRPGEIFGINKNLQYATPKQYSVAQYENTITVQDLIDAVRGRAEFTQQLIEHLSGYWDEVTVLIGIRDAASRIISHTTLYRHHAELIAQSQTDSPEAAQQFLNNWSQFEQQQNQHHNSYHNTNPQAIRDYIANMSHYLEYPTLDLVTDKTYPSNVNFKMIRQEHALEDAKTHMPDVFNNNLTDWDFKSLATNQTVPKYQNSFPTNKLLTELNTASVENLRNKL